jgi:hypothetical protein
MEEERERIKRELIKYMIVSVDKYYISITADKWHEIFKTSNPK